MSGPNACQLALLTAAVPHIQAKDYEPYLRLRRLIRERPPGFEAEFCRLFAKYYGLNRAAVGQAFLDRFFDILFTLRVQEAVDPYTPILRELYEIPRRKGDKALQCSFVSKLVATLDDTRPIFDSHVGGFFGIAVPSVGSVDFRIAGFVASLAWLRQTYQSWCRDPRFQHVIASLIQGHPALGDCAGVILADMLVWTVGRAELR